MGDINARCISIDTLANSFEHKVHSVCTEITQTLRLNVNSVIQRKSFFNESSNQNSYVQHP